MAETATMVCEECGEGRFSWIARQVQFGDVHRKVNDDGEERFWEEAQKNGPITGDDIDENGIYCTTCETDRTYDELVPEDSQ